MRFVFVATCLRLWVPEFRFFAYGMSKPQERVVTMFLPHLRHLLAAATLTSLLIGCASGSSTTPLGSQQNQSNVKKLTTRCPCLYVADIDNASVTVYAEGATGNATPIQTIRGSYTGLSGPTDVAVDASRDIYVTNHEATKLR